MVLDLIMQSGVLVCKCRRMVAAAIAAGLISPKWEANPGKGALQLDGQMIDAPHLKQARRVVVMAEAARE